MITEDINTSGIAWYVLYECDKRGNYKDNGEWHVHEWETLEQLKQFYQDTVRRSTPWADRTLAVYSSITTRYGNTVFQRGDKLLGVQCIISRFMGPLDNALGAKNFEASFTPGKYHESFGEIISTWQYERLDLELLKSWKSECIDFPESLRLDENRPRSNTSMDIVDLNNESNPSGDTTKKISISSIVSL